MMDEFEAMFNDVISGKSIRDCEKQYGINRNTFVTMCKQIFPEGSEQREKLERVLSYNKSDWWKKTKYNYKRLINWKHTNFKRSKIFVSKERGKDRFTNI